MIMVLKGSPLRTAYHLLVRLNRWCSHITSNNIMATINNITSRAKRSYPPVSKCKTVVLGPLDLRAASEAGEPVHRAAIIKVMDVEVRVWVTVTNTIIITLVLIPVVAASIHLITHKWIVTKNIMAANPSNSNSSHTTSGRPCLQPLAAKNNRWVTPNMKVATIR